VLHSLRSGNQIKTGFLIGAGTAQFLAMCLLAICAMVVA